MTEKFKGFTIPKSNYFRLPNNWTDITHDMTSMSEMKVVEYVLRHTWGYNGQENESKRISTEEFVNGRKKKNGERIDRGTGLSPESVRLGLKKAVEHGFLEVEEDKRDLARIKRKYRLVLENRPLDSRGQDLESRPLESRDLKKVSGDLKKGSRDRTWKDNSRNPTKEDPIQDSLSGLKSPDRETEVSSSPAEGSSTSPGKKKEPTPFDFKAAEKLHGVVSSHIKVNGRFERKKWAQQFRLMRERDGRTKKEIVETIRWYAGKIGDEFIPETFSAGAFRRKFDRMVAAMKRVASSSNGKKLTRDNMYDSDNCVNGRPRIWVGRDGRRYDGALLERIRKECGKRFGRGLPLKNNLDEVLVDLGETPGSIPVEEVGSVW
jgi:hypothetical protein